MKLFITYFVLTTQMAWSFGHWDTYHVADSYYIYNQADLTPEILAQHILNIHHGKEPNQKFSALQIATMVIKTAGCFEIDAYYLAGLLKGESAFKTSATSNTGARGIAQFTSIALHEVFDQLGYLDSDHAAQYKYHNEINAGAKGIEYFRDVVENCFENWTDVWDLPSMKKIKIFHETKVGNNYYYKMNRNASAKLLEIMTADPQLSIIYAAIHLKVTISNKINNNPKAQLKHIFELAIKSYNGSTEYEKKRLYTNAMNTVSALRSMQTEEENIGVLAKASASAQVQF
ncbi:MAG: transglycosylase SLT domain-containing protein [Bacteriovoracaceae bacterium]|nr:transglycosylase SLT domain-containing protein [Bacteriovoracaceae bacterium]